MLPPVLRIPRPNGPLPTPWRAEAKVGGDIAPDGVPVQVDLPQDLRLHNTGGRDGAGLCVFTSINHAARWQAIEPLLDFQQWMKSKPGGGYPEKVAAMITQKCKELAVPEPKYVQVEGSDLEPIRVALKIGRHAVHHLLVFALRSLRRPAHRPYGQLRARRERLFRHSRQQLSRRHRVAE